MLGEANMRAAFADDLAQRLLPLGERPLAPIDAVEAEEIEGHEQDGVGAALLQGGDQRRKLADAVIVEHDRFAVDQRALAFEGGRVAGDGGELAAPVEAGAGVELRVRASRRLAPGGSRRILSRRSSFRPRAAPRRSEQSCGATNAGSFGAALAAGALRGAPFSICLRVRSVETDLGNRDVRLSSSSANSSRSLMRSQFSRFSLVCMRTSTQPPRMRSPWAMNLISPFFTRLGGIAVDRREGRIFPENDRAAAILALRDKALEGRIVERMVLGAHRQPPVPGIGGGAARHRPTHQHAVDLQPQVVVIAGARNDAAR